MLYSRHSVYLTGACFHTWSENLHRSGPNSQCNSHLPLLVFHMNTFETADDPEDILSSSLQTLYDFTPIVHSSPGSVFMYTVKETLLSNPTKIIELKTPDTQASNWDLHASSIWVAAVYLADHIEDLELHQFRNREVVRILELGAGAGLPSILIASVFPNARVTISDYPDDGLIQTLSRNIQRNDVSGRARAVPYDWGTDISSLIDGDIMQGGPENEKLFDVVIAADTLWNPALHKRFIQSLTMCLKRSSDARVHLVAGLHTGRYTIQSFLREIEMETRCDLIVENILEREVSGTASRRWRVSRAESEDERERRRWVVWIVLRWRNAALE